MQASTRCCEPGHVTIVVKFSIAVKLSNNLKNPA